MKVDPRFLIRYIDWNPFYSKYWFKEESSDYCSFEYTDGVTHMSVMRASKYMKLSSVD